MTSAERDLQLLDADGNVTVVVSITALADESAGVVDGLIDSIVADQPDGHVRETGGETLDAESVPRANAFGALQIVERYDNSGDCRTTYRPRHGNGNDAEMLVERYDDGEWHEVGIADIPTLEVNGVRSPFHD